MMFYELVAKEVYDFATYSLPNRDRRYLAIQLKYFAMNPVSLSVFIRWSWKALMVLGLLPAGFAFD